MSDDITIKEIVLNVQRFIKECVKNWWLIAIGVVLIGGLFLYNAMQVPATYSAKLTFMVNEDEGSGGGIAGLLGQFGLGGISRSNFNLDKIIELSKSRKIVSEALFKKVSINNREDFLANHIIELYDLHNQWKEAQNGLEDFMFTHEMIDSFNRKENKALKNIHKLIVGNQKESVEGIVNTGYSENTGILKMTGKSVSEELSIALSTNLYNTLRSFYINKTNTNFEKTYNILKLKVDSIAGNLKDKNYALLRFEDANRNLSLRSYQAKKLSLQAEITKLTTAYGEAYKNLEVAEFALKNNTPDIVTIDEPIPPLRSQGESKFRAFILGALVGAFLSIAFVVIRRIYKDAMQ